ncbi:MAG: phosphoglycerate dehydrogenase [Elusimicrobia bacterium]|nr:phosphoglycerate dehydrogenase [Elusimicrobiota bacterium]
MAFKVLVTDPIDREGLRPLEGHKGIDLQVELAPSKEKLGSLLKGVNAWLVRSETKVTAEWIQQAKDLKLIGRAGVGVDNIDLSTASRHGIAVINAPQGNTIAACEHTWALILALSRNVPQADATMKQGGWDRSKFMGAELQGKTLGVVGLGRIGREVAKRGVAFGMKIVGHDPYVSNEQVKAMGFQPGTLKEVLEQSDFFTLHVPGSDKTRGLINEETSAWIKKGAYLVNCARGELVPAPILVKLIESGRLAGAAIDVFEKEPLPADSPLRKLPTVILTPHLGASTKEAQRKVAEEVSRGVIEFFEKGIARYAINLPGFDPDTLEAIGPYLYLADTLGRFLAQMTDSGLREVSCTFQGGFEDRQTRPIAVSALKGILSVMLDQQVSFINAPLLADERGIKLSETRDPMALEGFSRLLTISAATDSGVRKVSGTLLDRGEPRIVRLGDLIVDVKPQGKMLVLTNQDRPGMIGHVGQLLGRHKVNIADMRVGRHSAHGEAVMVISMDDDVPPAVQKELAAIDGITGVRWVKL